MIRIMCSAGGTLGHINPMLATVNKIKEIDKDAKIALIGSIGGMEEKVFSIEYERYFINKIPFPRKLSLDILLFIPRQIKAVLYLCSVMKKFKPMVVLGFGGFVSAPTYIAAKLQGIDIIVHEQNAKAGLANILGGFFAKKIALTTNNTKRMPFKKKTVLTGMPLKKEYDGQNETLRQFTKKKNIKTIVITGGSLGAQKINDTCAQVFSKLLNSDLENKFEVYHLCGKSKTKYVKDIIKNNNYHILESTDRMHELLDIADLVISRSGASITAEITAKKVCAIYIPLSIGNGEQKLNIKHLVDDNKALMIEEKDLSCNMLLDLLIDFIKSNPNSDNIWSTMKNNLQNSNELDSSTLLAKEVLSLINLYLIGIGGAGMSVLANILKSKGFCVLGSDKNKTPFTDILEKQNIKVFSDQSGKNISKSIDAIIFSTAIKNDNLEVVRARKLGISVIHRSIALNSIMGEKSVLIAGSHGKTTTTAMTVHILKSLNINPSYAIGGAILDSKTNEKISGSDVGNADIFVAEADESDKSFLNYSPMVAVINNIDPDHLDNYKNEDDFYENFYKFTQLASKKIVVCSDDKGVKKMLLDYFLKKNNLITVGLDQSNNFVISNVLQKDFSTLSFDLFDKEKNKTTTINVRATGEYNAINAAMSLVSLIQYGLKIDDMKDCLSNFCGVKRRFETRKIDVGGKNILLIDDYAHHPTEVRKLLEAVIQLRDRFMQDSKILVLFQPHLYSRTQDFAQDFANSLALADFCIVTGVYAARESFRNDINGQTISVNFQNKQTHFSIENKFDAAKKIEQIAKNNDIVLTVGAGDIDEVFN